MSDERLNNFETRLAYLDRQFDEMNSVILEQAAMIRLLKAKIDRLEAHDEEEGNNDSELSPSEIAARDKPPHY